MRQRFRNRAAPSNKRGDQLRFGRGFGDQQPFLPGTADDLSGDREQPVAPPLQVLDSGNMACGKDGELHPRHAVDREHGQVGLELVCINCIER